ncbi:type III-B CRISPR module RAMP protein Cmr4 [Nodularia sp. LEGE 04288]|uniref:type III-B CRISPR module RAMP protein Cmr4 n=1 Tax=Nodularia sp. LEGE 04288 TaxID=1828639 RepID=UPI001D10D43D|nr:type III-B CRISPR module RAMP protein Cmr4 [Nodularia sp. LEGE 04288]MCC2694872.1 type III-B CRISPR module RAMP protein Cmr4 [Nodularia sp. LEGE 04288]
MKFNLVYLYLISPLHTGGATQEGNLLGIARESHTNLPYAPSSTIRGRLRASAENRLQQVRLFGPQLEDLKDAGFVAEYEKQPGRKVITVKKEGKEEEQVVKFNQLEQGDIWVGDGSILWLPVPSLSHGVIWITCPMLLERWLRFHPNRNIQPADLQNLEYKTNLGVNNPIYLKDAIIRDNLQAWGDDWQKFVPEAPEVNSIKRVLVLPDQYCTTVMQMSLWRQVKIKLDQHKQVDNGFRYEEAIPPDTLMYFPWGTTFQANGTAKKSTEDFQNLVTENSVLQIGGQEGLGRGFVQAWSSN